MSDKHEAPERLKAIFDWYNIEPRDTPEAGIAYAEALEDGCVYFIKSQGYIKIGITNGTASARLNMLQVGNPHKIEIFKEFRCKNRAHYEKMLHGNMNKYHYRGEWYNLPDSIKNKIERANTIEDACNIKPTSSK